MYIFVLDDSKPQAEMIREAFRDYGCKVDVANSYQTAKVHHWDKEYDVVMADYVLTGGNDSKTGLDFLIYYKSTSLHNNARTVLYTAYNGKIDYEGYVDEFVYYPEKSLLDVVKKIANDDFFKPLDPEKPASRRRILIQRVTNIERQFDTMKEKVEAIEEASQQHIDESRSYEAMWAEWISHHDNEWNEHKKAHAEHKKEHEEHKAEHEEHKVEARSRYKWVLTVILGAAGFIASILGIFFGIESNRISNIRQDMRDQRRELRQDFKDQRSEIVKILKKLEE